MKGIPILRTSSISDMTICRRIILIDIMYLIRHEYSPSTKANILFCHSETTVKLHGLSTDARTMNTYKRRSGDR